MESDAPGNGSRPRPVDRYKALEQYYEMLEEMSDAHGPLLVKLIQAGGGDIYAHDHLIFGVAKRSLDALDGLVVLTHRWNFSAAGGLLRIQVDSLLRLVYLASVPDADEVARAILLEGKSFRDLKDEDGKKLTDARLKDYARPHYPWIDEVYAAACDFVHFSIRHCLLTVQDVNERDRRIDHAFGIGNENVPEEDIATFLNTCCLVTDALLKIVFGAVLSRQERYAVGP